MEQTVLYIVFFMLGSFILINSGLDEMWKMSKQKKHHIQEQQSQALGGKSHRIERYVSSEKKLVHMTHTNATTYVVLMVASIVGGWLFGKLVFTDSLVSLAIAGICIVLPHAFLVIKGTRDTRELAENLEGAMRIITHEYIACLDIEKAVANSVDVIDHDKPFREFLVDSKLVSANIERNLRRLESKEDNLFFSRWIDQLILTQNDSTQIVNLMPILQDMNDAKTAQRKNDTKIASAWRDYFTMLFIILLSPLLIRFIQYQWYASLINTLIGKILIISMLASLVWATGRALKINKPITG